MIQQVGTCGLNPQGMGRVGTHMSEQRFWVTLRWVSTMVQVWCLSSLVWTRLVAVTTAVWHWMSSALKSSASALTPGCLLLTTHLAYVSDMSLSLILKLFGQFWWNLILRSSLHLWHSFFWGVAPPPRRMKNLTSQLQKPKLAHPEFVGTIYFLSISMPCNPCGQMKLYLFPLNGSSCTNLVHLVQCKHFSYM